MLRKIILILVIPVFSLSFYVNGIGQSPSEYALIRRKVMEYPEIWKMTKSEAMTQFGKQLFINPLSASQSYVMDPTYYLYSGMAFQLDMGWNRMLYSECLDDWIRAYGTRGSGSGQFSWPKRLDCEAICNDTLFSAYYYIFVADASNNRIVKLRYDWRFENQSIINDGVISGNGLELPLDIDINNGFDFYPDTNDYLWVLNGNSQIKRFTFDGTLKSTYGSYGSGVDQFCRPTAIVSGRHYALSNPYEPYANTHYFFVADRGNNRIVWLYKNPGSEAILWMGETYTDRDIVDLETDNFGHIWAVDRANGQVIKYLMQVGGTLFPLCTFGSSGFGENQFYHPVSLSNTGGYLGCGNVYVLESWTDSSGGQYFTIATDIVDYNVYSDSNHFTHCANYVLVDPAGIYFKIYNESGNLIRTVQPVYVYYSGPELLWWDGKNDAEQTVPSGNYLMKVSAVSVYADINEPGNPHADSITKEGWVCNVHQNDILGDVNSNLTVESADIVYLINYLFKGGPGFDPFWKGDTNGDCKVSVGDTVYLINYLFKGGPAPQLNFGCSPWKCQS